jgi:thioredoxin-dependent peroxiredoxin
MLLATGAGALALQAQQPPAAGKTNLKVGDSAPAFTKLRSTAGGDPVSLADFKGKNTVVLAFFPAAFTGGCTKEMKAFHADIEKFTAAGAKVFGISSDNLPSQSYWAKEVLHIDVPLLSDFQRKTAESYGVLGPQGMASRTTFVIDSDGKIIHIDEGQVAIDPAGALTACSRKSH